jgi:Protein of unknown function (DUF3237)
MITLEPLCTMTLQLKDRYEVGGIPTGQRWIAEIADARLSGRLAGRLVGQSSADWFTMTATGVGLPDVRLGVQTDDGALVLIRYFGRIRLVPGQQSFTFVAPVFETGDARYEWLNEVQAVGKGIMAADRTHLDYEFYEVR